MLNPCVFFASIKRPTILVEDNIDSTHFEYDITWLMFLLFITLEVWSKNWSPMMRIYFDITSH